MRATQIGHRVEVATERHDDPDITAFDELEVEPADEELPAGQAWPVPPVSSMGIQAVDESSHLPVPDMAITDDTHHRLPPPPPEAVPDAPFLAYFGPPENLAIALPSSSTGGNQEWKLIELRLRKVQAERQLQNLREVIAEKSFLYSHVIRVAPRKAVRTRARTNIAKHNIVILHLCRTYMKTRAALLQLGAPPQLYPVLLKEHVKASTAILDPNLPGASRLQLSWIWQVSGDQSSSTESLLECMKFTINFFLG